MPSFTGAVPRVVTEKHGERVSVLDFGAKADGVLLFDGAINASDKTLTSATANFTEELIGLTIWVEDAGGAGVDFISTVESINSPTSLETTDNAVATVSNVEVRIGTDNTSFIQGAFDTLDSVHGRRLEFPSGRYLTLDKLDLRGHQMLCGHGWAYDTYNANPPSVIMCCGNVPVLNNTDLVTGDGWSGGNVRHLSLRGTKRTGSKGLYSALSLGAFVEYCAFDHFGDQSLHLENGIFGIHIIGCSATGSCLERSRLDYVGVFDVAQTDLFMEKCEVSASCSHDGVNPVPSVDGSFGDGFIAAICVRAGNSWINNCMAHHAQVGVYVGPGTSDLVCMNVRSDDNQGHDFVIDGGGNTFIGCRAFASGQDTDGTYSAFLINGPSNNFDNCQVQNFGYAPPPASPIFNRYKHAFHTDIGSGFAGCKFTFNQISPWACTDEEYKHSGAQIVHPRIDLSVLDPTGVPTVRVEADLSIRDFASVMVKTTAGSGARGLADEKVWRSRLNYDLGSPGYSQLLYTVATDDYNSETPYMVVSRTGMTVDFIQFYNALVQILNGLDLTGKLRIANATTSYIQFLVTTGIIQAGSGSPEGVVTAVGGSLYLDGAGKVWAKTTGTGNTGWSNVTALFTGNSLGDLLVGNSSGGFSNLTIGATNKVLRVVSGTAAWGDINADVIADGSVSNTEFQYLDGLTGGIQAQLNGIAASISTLQADVLNLQNDKADAGVNTGAASAGTPHTHTQT